jgi:alpha-beta hydrolase superfamily lysophospholipase
MAEPQAFFFGPAARPLWGCLHSGEAAASLGVVVCNPLGVEAISAHRSLRHLAERLARRGVPVLRFDYAGTGDSQGEDDGADQVPQWLASLHEAIDTLKARTGVHQVALIGLRAGALLGACAMAERADVVGLAAWTPVWQGRRYVRELTALQAALRAALPSTPAAPASSPAAALTLEAAGFVYNPATVHALQQLDIATIASGGQTHLLWLERDDMPAPAAAALERLRAQGFVVTQGRVGGFAEMIQEPQRSVVPTAALDALCAWVGGLTATTSHSASANAALLPPLPSPTASATPEVLFGERAVSLQGMEGICSFPARGKPTVAVLVLNSGAIHRVGPNRMYVPLARQMAAQGALVLRLDLSGLGESPVRAGEPENTVYATPAVADVLAAVRWLREQAPGVPVRALGLCSGGYHAFKAAVAGAPFDACVVINPLTFFWRPEMAAELLLPPHRVSYMATQYLQRSLWSGHSWRKLLGGGVDLRIAGRIVWRFSVRRLRDHVREAARCLKMPVRDDLARELAQVAAQGTALHFVFATGDPGHALLLEQGGNMVQRLLARQQLSLRFIPSADHTFTPQAAQEQLMAQLLPLLLACAAPVPKVLRSPSAATAL